MEHQKGTLTLRFLAEPTDVNFGGKVHGGMVMKWIDQAGYACARNWCGGYCVTVYVGGIRFLKPIRIGYLVEIQARVIYTGRTSMHLSIDVWANDPTEDTKERTTHCVIIFVAVDESGQPVPVPNWSPKTDRDKELEQYAIRLMELRSNIQEEMDRQHD